jgi:hypothetical protein
MYINMNRINENRILCRYRYKNICWVKKKYENQKYIVGRGVLFLWRLIQVHLLCSVNISTVYSMDEYHIAWLYPNRYILCCKAQLSLYDMV